MERTREDIEKQAKECLENDSHDGDLGLALILLEVWLDIRDCLFRMEKSQGIGKWGSKI